MPGRIGHLLRVTVIASLLSAAPSGRAAAADDGTEQARALFQRAEISFNLGKFPEALADYQAAYQAKPLPAFLFNIAQCYRNIASYERARFFYRRYLALEPRTSNRRLVEDLVAEMTRLMDKQRTGGQTVPVMAVGTAPSPLLASAPPPAGQPATSLLTTGPEAEQPPIYKRWWFWTGAGAVVAGGVVAAVLLSRDNGLHGSLATIDGR